MFVFNPLNLEKEFRNCLDILRKNFPPETLKDLLYDFDFDEESDEEIVITPETEINLGITECDDITFKAIDFIDFVNEFTSAVIVDDTECWTSKRVLYNVEPSNIQAHSFIYYAIREANSKEDEKNISNYLQLVVSHGE
ncbi:MAG: hypothetical protein JW976_12065 [Syntrophaceae bacterium]|nr:hypothetical protein [Syntrophaceae bacterium]